MPGKWELNPGDGAFYGPKIDITISDAMKRQFQCATIQLDFQLPQRFGLQFRKPTGGKAAGEEASAPAAAAAGVGAGEFAGASLPATGSSVTTTEATSGSSAAPAAPAVPAGIGAGEFAGAQLPATGTSVTTTQASTGPSATPASADFERPVMIHRAILGSLERFIAILTEHFAGKWPFWVSPRQVMIVPIAIPGVYEYAQSLKSLLWSKGFYVEVDQGPDTLNKKIRNAEIAQWNFIFVVGATEMETNSVNVRNRDQVGEKVRNDETIKVDVVLEQLTRLREERRIENKLV